MMNYYDYVLINLQQASNYAIFFLVVVFNFNVFNANVVNEYFIWPNLKNLKIIYVIGIVVSSKRS